MSKDYPDQILDYLILREAVFNSKGFHRCDKEINGDVKCLRQCQKCNEYYQKLKEK